MDASPSWDLVRLFLGIGFVIVVVFGWRYFRWRGNELGVALTKSSPRTQEDWDLIKKSAESAKYGISRFVACVIIFFGFVLLGIGFILLRESVEIIAAIGAVLLGFFITGLLGPPLISSIVHNSSLVDPKKMFSPIVIKLAAYLLFYPAAALEVYWFFVARSETSISFGEITSLVVFVYLVGFAGLWRALQKK